MPQVPAVHRPSRIPKPVTGGCTPGEPPSCVPQGRGGCTPGKPLSCLRQERVRGRTGRAALLRSARAGGCTPGKPPSCLRQGRVHGRTGRAALLRSARAGGCTPGKPPSCLRQGRKFCFYTWAEACGRERMAHESVRLTAGKNCLFLKLVAGEASPAPPGRGLRPLPTPLKGALPPSPPNGGKYPPYPPLTGRVAPAGRAGP